MPSLTEVKFDKKWKWVEQPLLDFVSAKDTLYEWIGVLLEYKNPFNDNIYGEPKPPAEATQAWVAKSHAFIDALTPPVAERLTAVLAEDFYKSERFWFRQGRALFVSALMHCVYTYDKDVFLPFVVKTTEKAYTHIKGSGSLSSIVGHVGMGLLRENPTAGSVAAILLMRYKARHYVFAESVEQALSWIRENTAFDEDRILDTLVDDFGITGGRVTREIYGYTATLIVSSYKEVDVVYRDPSGKILKSEPAALKKQHGDELKALKQLLQDARKTLVNQKLRLENSWKAGRMWRMADWQKYIIDHPLTGVIGRQLIWQFMNDGGGQSGVWREGRVEGASGQVLDLSGCSGVRLWHPAEATVEAVQQWRQYIFDRQLLQPFKQAFREVYMLTDAEIATATHSLRFSGHVLRHYKLKALAEQRQWRYTSVFSYDPPSLKIPQHDVEVHLNIQSDGDIVQVANVSFYTLRNRQLRMLTSLSPVIFSEILRDVDLFVATCSIGIEEEWNQGRYHDYWRSYSDRDLSAIGQTRREVLSRLLPALKISAVSQLTEKLLVVKGKLRTYKIHLDSTNILMEPNDQYLCIVPDRRARQNTIFLPFDEDAALSIILSKAMLLAEDDKITDTTILRQINF